MQRRFNLADLFEIAADAAPERTALVAGGIRLTYRELDRRANRLAHHLGAAGIGPGDRVAILAHNRAEWLETQIGALKLRAVPVNVNYRYTGGELAHVLADSGAAALVAERALLARLDTVRLRGELPALRHVIVIDDDDGGGDATGNTRGLRPEAPGRAVAYEEALAAESPERGFGERSGDDLYLLYTGGTTGLPKGVMWRSEDVFASAMFGGSLFGEPAATPDDIADRARAGGVTFMVCAPMMHGAGMWVAWIALTSGSPLVLWCGRRFDAGRVLQIAAEEGAKVLLLVGDAMARPIADALTAAGPDEYDLSGLLAIATGGSVTSPDVKARLRQALPDLPVILDAFGGSETGAAGQAVESAADGSPRFMPRSEDVAVLDESLRPIAAGSGEIGTLARTGRIPLGYWNDPDGTAATFRTDPEGRRWVLQGDLARVDADGAIILLGRGSLVINTGGEKVFAEEVEMVLKSHPDVYDALVVGVPDDRLGHRVAAVVSPVPGRRIDPAAGDGERIVAHCRETLAGYKVPRDLRVVPEVPRSPAGKADYRWARDLYRSTPTPAPPRPLLPPLGTPENRVGGRPEEKRGRSDHGSEGHA